MPQKKFKVPRSSYEELTKIIKAYGQLTEPSSLVDVSQLAALNRTVVSANNAFLVETNIIEGGNRKGVTKEGKALAQALMHEIPDEIQNAWRSIIESTEFLNKMLLAARIRRGMEVNNFVSHIAFSSGEQKSKPVLTGARTVVDIIRASGLVREKDDRIIPVTEVVLEQGSEEETTEIPRPSPITRQIHSTRLESGVSISVQLRIDAKPDELDDLGQRIRKLVEEISAESKSNDTTDD